MISMLPQQQQQRIVASSLNRSTNKKRLWCCTVVRLLTTTTVLVLVVGTSSLWFLVFSRSSNSHNISHDNKVLSSTPGIHKSNLGHKGSSSSSSSSARIFRGETQDWINFGGDLRSSSSSSNDKKPQAPPEGSFFFQGSQPCQDQPNACQIHFPSSSADHTRNDQQYILSSLPQQPMLLLALKTQRGFKPKDPPPLFQLEPIQQQEENKSNNNSPENSSIPNQDRSLVLQPLVIRTSPNTVETDCMLLLLADGHGPNGHLTAAAVQRDLPFRILRMLEQPQHQQGPQGPDDISSLLKQAFVDCDNEVAKKAGGPVSGTTTIIVLKIGATVYMASVGDSTALLIEWIGNGDGGTTTTTDTSNNNNNSNSNNNKKSNNPYNILQSMPHHKPHLAEERQRIERLKGQVYVPIEPGSSSRVIIPSVDAKTGQPYEMALAMSRSLGDEDGKLPGWLLAEPTVLTYKLDHDKDNHDNNKKQQQQRQYFVLVASDGVSDHHPLPQVVERAGMAMFDPTTTTTQSLIFLNSAVDEILAISAVNWTKATLGVYRDDMTLLVSRL
ncbi:hypothetical protein ACA910_007812 [Epithemia clementina (nom. ined.)]